MKVDDNNAKPAATKALAGKQSVSTAPTTTTTMTTMTPAATLTSQRGAAAAGAGTRYTSTYAHTLLKKKSCTTLLCELTRLKTQQKYLECSQVKLNPANYEDPPASANNNNGATAFAQPPAGIEAMQLANEIECMKVQLEEDLKVYRENSFREVQELRDKVKSIREDVQQPDRLRQCTLPMLRERVITINTQLMQLCDKNQNEFEKLREECETLERNNDVLVKV
ncbi:uncharacterized protein LOC118754231 [Rhagoletis pomonella]|uniref:uncharacterized protein LOC118754231 n=1 Tax=Rhagoletis pomonella TaxID=28610 RepID=UPI00178250EC|nr:uncharacterized protein LOC118754231 [Rhagoletis pomonella]